MIIVTTRINLLGGNIEVTPYMDTPLEKQAAMGYLKGYVLKKLSYIVLDPLPGQPNWAIGEFWVRERVTRDKGRELRYSYYEELENMKRRQTEKQTVKGKWEMPTEPFLADHPNIARECTDAFWDDGKPREVCTISIRFGHGEVHLSLNDKECSQSTSTMAKSLGEAMALLEEALADGKNVWRKWGQKRR